MNNLANRLIELGTCESIRSDFIQIQERLAIAGLTSSYEILR